MCEIDELECIAESHPSSKNKDYIPTLGQSGHVLESGKNPNITKDADTVQSPSDCTYRPDPALEVSSLSMRLMHKPSRAQNELEKASDPTKQNSLLNSIMAKHGEENIVSSSESRLSFDIYGNDPSPESFSIKNPSRHSLVRKKSGEIVKSLLKDKGESNFARPRSLPATPTFKQVHFGGDTDVRYFKEKDRPTAILALNSPKLVEDDEDDDFGIPSLEFELEGGLRRHPLFDPRRKSYFDYYDEELNSHIDKETDSSNQGKLLANSPPVHDWKLSSSNFSVKSNTLESIHSGEPVFLETVFLSADKRYLLGQIAVLNLAYEKSVIVRYSLDNWYTIVEIKASYVPDFPAVLKRHNYDRFMFKIPLDLFVNGIQSSVDPLSISPSDLCPELCVKYLVDGQVLWDNNKGQNYLFSLKKEPKQVIPLRDIPNTARTKQEVHEKKPKYSSSYLKRIKSDTSVPRKQGDLGGSSNILMTPDSSDKISRSQMNGSSSTNDFERNNFYLSSPLFSSLTHDAGEVSPHDETPRKLFTQPELESSFSLDRSRASEKNKTQNVPTRQFLAEPDSDSFPRMSRDFNEPMSYKDFLDSYCFFNSNFKENSSKATLVMSDSPLMNDHESVINGPGEKPVHSVSTFLT